jgi:hypothetical protein
VLCSAPCTPQNNSTLQTINVTNNDHMDKSWQTLLQHVLKPRK